MTGTTAGRRRSIATGAVYFHQVRARGLCIICREPIPDDDPRLAHPVCTKLGNEGMLWGTIRALSPAARLAAVPPDRRRRRVPGVSPDVG